MDKSGKEKIPIDARLLSDAIIEFNITRRSVSLYPRDHPVTKDSLERAYSYLKKLFEIRQPITLGVAKDTLIIDEYTLDKRNPVFREFGLALHNKGIASVTFYSGLTMDELYIFNEIITSKDIPAGQTVIEEAGKKGLSHISFSPIDVSKFQFVEEKTREKGSSSGTAVWEDYIVGLLEGRLADSESEGVILSVPPEQIAEIINERLKEDGPEETYDRVITTYLKKRERQRIRPDVFNRFITLLENLTPELKKEFLKKAFTENRLSVDELNHIMKELTPDDIDSMISLFKESRTAIPESIQHLLGKLYEIRKDSTFFDMFTESSSILHDIEFDKGISALFTEDHYSAFVSEDYQRSLDEMMKAADLKKKNIEEFKEVCNEIQVDRKVTEIMLEILESDFMGRAHFLTLLTRLSEVVNEFLDTGRFSEISTVYNAIYSYSFNGRFREEALNMIEYYFRSRQFISRFIDAIRLWGRIDMEGLIRLSRTLRHQLISPLIDVLNDEKDSSQRKLFLTILTQLGSDVADEASKRLDDNRWYVIKNMIILIRETGGKRYMKKVKLFARHENINVALEAIRTLLHFNSVDAISYLQVLLKSDNPDVRTEAIRLSGMYKLKEVLPILHELLEKKDILGTESYYKIPIVRALSEIGDRSSIKHLMNVYNSKSLLYRSSLEELKLEIFKTIHKYRRELIRPLLEMGLKSKNREIVSICENLLKE